MWYKVKLAAADPAKHPIRRDWVELAGEDLLELASEVGAQLMNAVGQLQGTAVPYLEGLLEVGIEVQVWASSMSCGLPGVAEDARLLAMRQSVMAAPGCGSGSSRTATPTKRSDSSPSL